MAKKIKKITKKATPIDPNKRNRLRKIEYQEFIKFTALPRVLRSKEYGFD